MRFPLVFATLLLTVAMVACSQPYRRPSDFGRKYIVFGDTKRILCAPGSSCTTEWYQTQYFQNLDNDGVILHIDTNKYKVQEKNYYIQGNNGYNLVSVIRTYSWEWKYLHFQWLVTVRSYSWYARWSGLRNPGNICLWNPESRKYLLVESRIQETFACGIWNPGHICSWNLESRKHLLVESAVLLWNAGLEFRIPKSRLLGSGMQDF